MSWAKGNRWRGKIPIPEHAHPLVRRLIVEANRQKTTMKEIAERSGLRYETISDWRYRRRPTVDHLIAAFNVLGLTLVATPIRESRSESLRLDGAYDSA